MVGKGLIMRSFMLVCAKTQEVCLEAVATLLKLLATELGQNSCLQLRRLTSFLMSLVSV